MGMKHKHNPVPSGKNPSGDLTLMEIMKRFSTEEAARGYFEALRWPDGPVCPHCGNNDGKRIYKATPNPKKKIRAGLYKCASATSFTATIGTVCEDSHIPLNKWLIGFYMMCASKTQVSALQLQRQLEIGSYRSALHLCHRIRFALMEIGHAEKLTGTVEADETYIGGVKHGMGRRYVGNKTAVMAMVEQGAMCDLQVVERDAGDMLGRFLKQHVAKSAHLNTDEITALSQRAASDSRHTIRSITAKMNMYGETRSQGASPLRTPRKDFSAIPNARLMAPTITLATNIFRSILPNWTTSTTRAR